MKILELVTGGEPGGAQRHVKELSQVLVDQGHQVTVAHGGGHWLATHLDSRIGVHYLTMLGREMHPHRDLSALQEIVRLIGKLEPEVVHCHSAKAGMLGRWAAWRSGIPSVYTVHGFVFLDPTRSGLQRWFYRSAERWAARMGTATIAVARQDMVYASRFATKHQTYYIPNGVKEAPIVQHHTRGPVPRIGFMGRFSREKGMDWLLPLAVEHPEYQWIIAGDGDNLSLVQQAASHYPHLQFDGWVDDLDTWFASIDVLVQPSWKEGLPYTVLDAIARRVPVVATAVGGMPDVLADIDQKLLVAPGDAKGLYTAIQYALDQSDRLTETGSRYLSENFDFDMQMNKVVHVLQSVVSP
ncbi:MAG: glycosyltransferase [Sulfobacillus sp.]